MEILATRFWEENMKKYFGLGAITAAALTVSTAAFGFECAIKEASMDKPGGFPERALTMIVPYGPAGGSGQVAAAMAEAVTELTGIPINPDLKPGARTTDPTFRVRSLGLSSKTMASVGQNFSHALHLPFLK